MKQYLITEATLVKVLEALSNHMFEDVEGDSWNNDDVIEAHNALDAEINEQR